MEDVDADVRYRCNRDRVVVFSCLHTWPYALYTWCTTVGLRERGDRAKRTHTELGAPRRERGDASRAVGPSRDTHTPHTFSVSRLSPVSCGLLPPGGSRRKGGRSGFTFS